MPCHGAYMKCQAPCFDTCNKMQPDMAAALPLAVPMMVRAGKKKPPCEQGGITPRRAWKQQGKTYLADISATVVSSMRFEKPHSLSYHDDTFTRRPDTLVRVESKFDEAGLWLKSIDTSGSVW